MLAKAVQDHHPGLPSSLKSTTLSQHYKANGNALKPIPPTALNSTVPSWPPSMTRLQRSPSLANDGDSDYGTQEHGSKKVMIDLTQPRGKAKRLPSAVFFDENDFDDDADIDLDAEESPQVVTRADSTEWKSSATLLPDPSHKKPVTPQAPISSTPLPWSSSPLSHHQMPPPKPKVSSTPVPTANMTKRRTLPWVEAAKKVEIERAKKADRMCEDLIKGDSTQDKARIDARKVRRDTNEKDMLYEELAGEDRPAKRKRRNTDESAEDLMEKGTSEQLVEKIRKARYAKPETTDAYTPLPKDKPDSPYPWNKTASAFKEEQKKLRQGNKTLVKDNAFAKSNKKKRRETVAKVFLSDEQRSVLNLVAEQKKSVFFTGSAGTGKSVLLRETIKVLRDRYKREPDRVAVTASTGLAACNVGGVTLHSFAGIGLGKEPVPELVKKIKRNSKAKNRWIRTKILIVDEVSMVDGDLFDKLEAIARAIRNNGRPFGGIQLVITGDFFQLPPVPDYGKVAKFSFDAATWNTSIEHTIGLTQVFRQKDPVFANMLNEMRLGSLTPKSVEAFRSLSRPLGLEDDFEATELFPTRNEVDYANSARMRNLSGKEVLFRALDGGSMSNENGQRDKLLSNCMAPPSITLKKGAQVMLIKNIDETLVNGSVGKVIAFMDEKTFDIYHEDEDEFQAVETMDMDDEEMTKSRKKLKAMINKDLAGDTSQKWPLVRFAIADGTSRDLLCQQESWKIELPNGEIQASRSQIPLILAWALSIHKAQGQTLDRVKVDLGKIFEKGQAYVALSRATCQEGLQISRFDPKKVMAHDRVRTFYDGLYSVNQATSSKKQQNQIPTAKDFESHFLNPGFGPDDDEMQAMYG